MVQDKDKSRERLIDWDEYSRLCSLLADRVKEERDPETVVGIAHGGVIVGATVATILGKDFFPIKLSRRINSRVVRKKSKMLVPPTADLEGKRVLVVDDASSSGETMRAAVDSIKKHAPREVVTAVLLRSGAYKPDYAASYYSGEVKFPWMMEEGKKPQGQKPGRKSSGRKKTSPKKARKR